MANESPRFKATIEVMDSKPEQLVKAFTAELGNPKSERSSFVVRKAKGHVVFTITAGDAVALRAAADSVIKLIIVHENMKKISS